MPKLKNITIAHLLLIVIIVLSMFLRFYKYEDMQGFGWDQGRDAWKVRDVLQGKWPAQGPRTGIGDFYLGAAHYYILAPFYLLTGSDPVASLYHNVLIHVVTMTVIYAVIRRLFDTPTALLAALIYAVNTYVIAKNITPWNVSYIPSISFLIFFALVKVLQERYHYLYLVAILTGFFFHVHFTGIFLIPIVGLTILFTPNRKTALITSLKSFPLFLIWLLPNIYFDLTHHNSDSARISKFFSEYYHGFYVRFMLFRAQDSFLMLKNLLHYRVLHYVAFVLPITLWLFAYFKEKKTDLRTSILATIPWFLVPLVGFTLYSGPISDYYYLITIPAALVLLLYGIHVLIRIKPRIVIPILAIACTWYVWDHSYHWLFKQPRSGGLSDTKALVKEGMRLQTEFPYVEGDIKSYLYTIWKEQAESQVAQNIVTITLLHAINGDNLEPSYQRIADVNNRGIKATWLWDQTALRNNAFVSHAKNEIPSHNHGLYLNNALNNEQEIKELFELYKSIFGNHASIIGLNPENVASESYILANYDIQAFIQYQTDVLPMDITRKHFTRYININTTNPPLITINKSLSYQKGDAFIVDDISFEQKLQSELPQQAYRFQTLYDFAQSFIYDNRTASPHRGK